VNATLQEIRSWQHPHFERIVFEFRDDQIPGYGVQYLAAPVQECASGYTMDVDGEGFLEIRMQPAQMHEIIDQRLHPTIQRRERAVNRPLLRHLVHTCDYQDVVAWVAGVSSRQPYRVIELQDPPRLVVDIRSTRR
jgi:hypothetical protein